MVGRKGRLKGRTAFQGRVGVRLNDDSFYYWQGLCRLIGFILILFALAGRPYFE
ncbi:hypothetical protein [Neisseria sicca]|uniref:hypothetical protein n=1 Tax=Neisseria sicca TaxID=490 RepID=UPI001649B26C|nr:hypothetical protein [Neisseria sicca]